MATAAAPLPVGSMLRSWRQRRNLSQLELALDADVSARHISFLETGRSQPSREMVIRLAGELDVPLRERNRLLLAAGYAPVYGERSFEDPEMSAVREALDRFLRAHEPYPALVVDRLHSLVAANDALDLLLDGVAPHLLEPPANALRVALHPDGMASRTLNLGEWSSHLLRRLRREAQATGEEALYELYDEVLAYPGVEAPKSAAEIEPGDIILPLRIRDGQGELSFFSILSTFGTAADITLAELSIEAFYPSNARTAARMLDSVAAG